LDNHQKELLTKYKLLLAAWNKTHNLVSKNQIHNIEEHIQDSLVIAQHINKNVVDLGSGGGLPGLPLAITNPDKRFYLVESSSKKSAFLFNTISRLDLSNTTTINDRLENLEPKDLPESFDIVCRAVGTTELVVALSDTFLQRPNVQLKLMKTQDQFNKEEIPPGYIVKKIDKFPSKAKDKTRILVTIEAERKNG
jgi:16S rRNA (guanine(527)-N(7))-methyltransferase RsmG